MHLVHICDPQKLEFDVLLRHYFYGHDTPLTHIAWGGRRVRHAIDGCIMLVSTSTSRGSDNIMHCSCFHETTVDI